LFVTTMILATTGHVLYHQRRRSELRHPALLLLALLPLQITLGAFTVLSGRQPIINSLHVVTGASVLVTSLVLTLRAHRARFNEGAAGVRVPRIPPRDPDTLTAHANAGARA
jgi:heme A synthase